MRGIRRLVDKENIKAGAYLGGLWGPGPPGSPKGLQKERKKERKRNRKRERMKEIRGKEGKKKEKMKERGGKKEKNKVSQHDERGAMQFQVQAGAQGKNTSGAPN